MMYSIGLFILDTTREHLLLGASKEIVSNHSRSVHLLRILAEAYPGVVSKNELLRKLWQDDDITEWALSTQVYQLRQLLSAHAPDVHYIKTVHTQGFKLEIEPRIVDQVNSTESLENESIEKQQGQQSESEIDNDKNPQYKFGKWWITGAIACVLSGIAGYHWLKKPAPVYGEIYPKKSITLPVNKNWSSSEPDTLQFTVDGIQVGPIDSDPLYVSTSLTGAGFYQGAVFSMGIKVNQEFIDNKGGLRFYYQSTQDGWPGEWDCILDDIRSLDFEYPCRIDENAAFTRVTEKETVNFGVKLHQQQPIGGVTITSAKIDLPASISTDQGWRTTNNIKLQYDHGVAYKVKSLADQLSTFIKGPLNISGSKIAFTLEVDDSYKNSNSGIQFFIMNNNNEWQDCFMEDAEIQSNVFTKVCDFTKNKNPFTLSANEKINIGIRPFGQTINGNIKILGITVDE